MRVESTSKTLAVKPKLPDLTIDFVEVPEKIEAGKEATIKVLVKNIGEAALEGLELNLEQTTIGRTDVKKLL